MTQNDWIPVTERMPEEKEEIIMNFATQAIRPMVGTGTYSNGTWYYMGSLELFPEAVDAWMPLPEPYDGGAE